MLTEIVLRKDGLEVKTEVINPITGSTSTHREIVPYGKIPSGLNLLGIRRIEPLDSNEGLARFIVGGFSTENVESLDIKLRRGTRRERIARFLVSNKGKAYTIRELAEELKEKDLPNLQWEATLLIRQQKGFARIKKGGLLAYVFTG